MIIDELSISVYKLIPHTIICPKQDKSISKKKKKKNRSQTPKRKS